MLGLSPVPPRSGATLVIPQDIPVYRISAEHGFFADDHLYTKGSIMTWPDEPNLEMVPMNDLAHAKMKEFLKKLDIEGQKVARKAGKSYQSYADAYENSRELAKQDGSRVRLLNGPEGQTPLMGAKKQRRGQTILAEQEAPLTGGGKFSLDGRAQANKAADKGS